MFSFKLSIISLIHFSSKFPKGGTMSKIIIGLLIILLIVLFFLLFWIVVLSAALLFFRRKESRNKERLTENQGIA